MVLEDCFPAYITNIKIPRAHCVSQLSQNYGPTQRHYEAIKEMLFSSENEMGVSHSPGHWVPCLPLGLHPFVRSTTPETSFLETLQSSVGQLGHCTQVWAPSRF